MTARDYLLGTISQFRSTLDQHIMHLKCFDEYAIQVEGWLKGELVHLFDSEKRAGRLADFQTERGTESLGKKRIDCCLTLRDTSIIWIELKHWQIGLQKKQQWKASNYFSSKSIGIYYDAKKLSDVNIGYKCIMILATKNPEHEDWQTGLDTFNRNFEHLRLYSCTEPVNFPESYFVGLLEVSKC